MLKLTFFIVNLCLLMLTNGTVFIVFILYIYIFFCTSYVRVL